MALINLPPLPPIHAERAIPFEHMMYEHLQKWGPRKQEVKFFLRHEDSPTESSDQGVYTAQRLQLQLRVLPNTSLGF